MNKFIKKVLSDLSSDKEVIVVSSSGIKRRRIGVGRKIVNFLFGSWIAFSTVFIFLSLGIIHRQNTRINELKNVNYDLNSSINDLNIVVNNIKNYLSSLNYYDRFNKINVKKISDEKNFIKNKDLLSNIEYKNVLPVIDILDKNINVLSESIDVRIKGIAEILSESTVLKSKADNVYKVKYESEANSGELSRLENIFSNTSVLIKKNEITGIKDKIRYLAFLEDFIDSIPVSEPMQNYFLTSKYGSRIDPFTGEVRSHKGLDFAGPYSSKVFSTTDGVVEFSGTNGGFGNVVVINHGNRIKTAYAHLGGLLVKVGQKVSRGTTIGVQGNSGRSTGQHLHYEVLIDGKNVDPLKFINIGKKVY
jgi:murein DD-endopeptidase MepM/ murein hydrolase activator NlpD